MRAPFLIDVGEELRHPGSRRRLALVGHLPGVALSTARIDPAADVEADEILAAARGQAERMVQRSEVLRSAEAKARRVVEQARTDAARIRNECDDYCDERLAHLEAVLEKTMAVVALGRERLRPEPDENDPRLAEHDGDEDDEADDHDEEDDDAGGTVVFFDQDKS